MSLLKRKARPVAGPCSWCRAPQPDQPDGWTVAELDESFTARFRVMHPLGGFSENAVTVNAGPRTACTDCTVALAASRYADVAARGDGPGALPYIQAVARRLGRPQSLRGTR